MFLREAEKEESRTDGRWNRRTEGETESDTVAATGRERNGQFEAAACEFLFESRLASHIALNLLNNPISFYCMSISNVWYLLNILMFELLLFFDSLVGFIVQE